MDNAQKQPAFMNRDLSSWKKEFALTLEWLALAAVILLVASSLAEVLRLDAVKTFVDLRWLAALLAVAIFVRLLPAHQSRPGETVRGSALKNPDRDNTANLSSASASLGHQENGPIIKSAGRRSAILVIIVCAFLFVVRKYGFTVSTAVACGLIALFLFIVDRTVTELVSDQAEDV